MPIPINISASRGASILGLSKYKTSLETWLEIMEAKEPGFCKKNKYEEPEKPDNAAIRWGSAFEGAIIKLAQSKIENSVIGNRERLFCYNPKRNMRKSWPVNNQPEPAWLTKYGYTITCHLDGQYDPKTIHEGKTTSIHNFSEEWGEPGTDRIPLDYQIQAQAQLLVTGAKKVILSVLVFPRRPQEWEEMGIKFEGDTIIIPDRGISMILPWALTLYQMGYFHQYVIKSNPGLQKTLIKFYQSWWKSFVVKKAPPRPRNIDDIKKLVKSPVGTIVVTEGMERWHKEYKQINNEVNRVKKRKEQIKFMFLDYAKKSQAGKENPIDDDSVEKWIFRNKAGEKLFSYNGNKFM